MSSEARNGEQEWGGITGRALVTEIADRIGGSDRSQWIKTLIYRYYQLFIHLSDN